MKRAKRRPSAPLETFQHVFVAVYMTVHYIPLRLVSSVLKIVPEHKKKKTNVRNVPLAQQEILTAGFKKVQGFGMQRRNIVTSTYGVK